jgi:hypothetical protein
VAIELQKNKEEIIHLISGKHTQILFIIIIIYLNFFSYILLFAHRKLNIFSVDFNAQLNNKEFFQIKVNTQNKTNFVWRL